jgi:hypothetical protein
MKKSPRRGEHQQAKESGTVQFGERGADLPRKPIQSSRHFALLINMPKKGCVNFMIA